MSDPHRFGSRAVLGVLRGVVAAWRRSDRGLPLSLGVASWNSNTARSHRRQVGESLDLANKGVHAEVYGAEARRCLLRTILLLDDIVPLKSGPFEIQQGIDVDLIRDMFDDGSAELT
jgi:hypothetical protein